MRPLAVLHVHIGDRDGGAERQTAALLAGLARGGHRVIGLVRRGSPVERRAIEAGAPVFPVEPRFPSGPGGVLTWWSRGRARLLAARGGWEIVHFADAASYARLSRLLTAATAGGLEAGGPVRPPRLLVTHRGLPAGAKGGAPAPLRRHHRSGGTIHVASEALRSALVREGFDEDLLALVHPGVDVRAFAAGASARAGIREELGFGEEDEVVGAVAVLDRERGIGDLIDAFAILGRERPAARLLVVGDGPQRAALEARAQRAGLRARPREERPREGRPGAEVRFAGRREDVERVLHALDLFVYPGRGQEVFPLSLIEAMAAGVPVVARDQPGIREIIENGKQGLIVPGNDAESLARTIARVLADRTLARQIGRAGAVRVQRFHTQAMIDATESLYRRIVKAGREGR